MGKLVSVLKKCVCVDKIRMKIVNSSNKNKSRWLIKQGAIVGEGNRFNCDVDAFGSEPWFIKMGNDCLIAQNVHFITHDGGIKVLNSLDYFDDRMDCMGVIELGNNVYIGMGAYIMPNVRIGDNVIVGANSVVTHNIPSNTVVAGVPAKIIKTIDEYHKSLLAKKSVFPTATMSMKQKKMYFRDIDLFDKMS